MAFGIWKIFFPFLQLCLYICLTFRHNSLRKSENVVIIPLVAGLTSYLHVVIKEAMYRIWCGVNRLGDSGVNRLGDTSAFVNTAGQLLLTRRGKTSMDGVGIVFEFYTAHL